MFRAKHAAMMVLASFCATQNNKPLVEAQSATPFESFPVLGEDSLSAFPTSKCRTVQNNSHYIIGCPDKLTTVPKDGTSPLKTYSLADFGGSSSSEI